jgi:hypothetical protein
MIPIITMVSNITNASPVLGAGELLRGMMEITYQNWCKISQLSTVGRM